MIAEQLRCLSRPDLGGQGRCGEGTAVLWDAGFRAPNINLHIERQHRAYVGYLDAGAIILDTTDVAGPRLVTRLDYHPPMAGFTADGIVYAADRDGGGRYILEYSGPG